MYYINPTPNKTGNHGNPMGQPFPTCVTLPDDLLSPYLAAKGFVTLTVEDGAVTSLETNQEALEAYEADHPDLPPEKPEEQVTWAAMAAAIREGVNDVD
jgi:hypothetical protein